MSEITHVRELASGGYAAGPIEGAAEVIGITEASRHWAAIEEFVASGGEIEPYAPPAPTLADYQAAIQAHVDATARSRDYSDGTALAGYVNSTVPAWAAEAGSFVAWRDDVWLYAYAELDKVTGGQRPQPSVEDFIAELPAIDWPE